MRKNFMSLHWLVVPCPSGTCITACAAAAARPAWPLAGPAGRCGTCCKISASRPRAIRARPVTLNTSRPCSGTVHEPSLRARHDQPRRARRRLLLQRRETEGGRPGPRPPAAGAGRRRPVAPARAPGPGVRARPRRGLRERTGAAGMRSARDVPELPPEDVALGIKFMRQFHVVPVAADAAGVDVLLADPRTPMCSRRCAWPPGGCRGRWSLLRGEIDELIERWHGQGRSAMEGIVEERRARELRRRRAPARPRLRRRR